MAGKLPKQVEVALSWAKSNTLVVVFGVIAIGVPVGCYFASGMMGEGVRKEAQRRSQAYGELVSAANAKVSLPVPGGDPVEIDSIATPKIVEQFGSALERYSKDATEVYAAARAFNYGSDTAPKHRPVVDAGIFPKYDRRTTTTAEQVRFKMADAIAAAYQRLLDECRAGSPPASEKVAERVRDSERRYLNSELKVASRSQLEGKDDSKQKISDLNQYLVKVRIAEYTEAAKKLSMYADTGAFEVPSRASVTGLYKSGADIGAQDKALFELQWKLWVATDVMRAFAAANKSASSVLQSPVKRVLSLRVLPMETGGTAQAGGGEAASMSGETMSGETMSGETMSGENTGGAAGGGDGSGTSAEGGAVAAAPAEPGEPTIDIKVEASRDYSKRFTGRVSNGIYDVRVAEVAFIADTEKLPAIFDALAAQNFMTITNVRISPADPFAAARSGFLYGIRPVSEVSATIESLWFRDWTARHMPPALRTALGITSGGQGGESAEQANSAQGM